MKNCILIIPLLYLFAGCDPERSVEVDIEDRTADTDTVVVEQRDTVWIEDDRAPDTVVIEIPEDEQDPNVAPRDWTAGIIEEEKEVTAVSVLSDIRVARHDDFERIVIEFETEIPTYRVEYIDEPYIQCGSGNEMRLPGDGLLKIHLRDAAAHNEEGQSTVRRSFPGMDNIREVRLACDYEAHVHILAGVGSPNRFAVLELENPARLVVDIRR